MGEDRTASGGQGSALAERMRRVPLGILLLASALAMTGLGSIGAALYLALADRALSLWALGLALAIAPASLYLAYQLLCLRRWAWLAVVSLMALLLASSLVRLFADGEIPGAAGLEVVVEIAALAYLLRPRVRRYFAGTNGAAPVASTTA